MSNSIAGILQKKWRLGFNRWHGLSLALGCILLAFGIARLLRAPPITPAESVKRPAIQAKGQIIPWASIELYAPQNSFQVDGSTSTSDAIKITKLVPEGQQVNAGDTLAWFLFTGLDIQNRLLMKAERIKASLRQAKLQLEEERLLFEEQGKKAELRIAEEQLNVDRTVFSSRMAQEEAQLTLQEARLEKTGKDLERSRQKQFAADEIAYLESLLRRQEEEFRRFKNFEGRYQLKAPAAGVVSYAMNLDANRKVAEGDQLVTGSPVLLLAPSSEQGVRFFVKEKFLPLIRIGGTVEVQSRSSVRHVLAEIQEIEAFPQELGALKNSFSEDDALEKYYVCKARIQGDAGMAHGSEVEVVLHANP